MSVQLFSNKNGEKNYLCSSEVGKRGGEVVVVGDWGGVVSN